MTRKKSTSRQGRPRNPSSEKLSNGETQILHRFPPESSTNTALTAGDLISLRQIDLSKSKNMLEKLKAKYFKDNKLPSTAATGTGATLSHISSIDKSRERSKSRNQPSRIGTASSTLLARVRSQNGALSLVQYSKRPHNR